MATPYPANPVYTLDALPSLMPKEVRQYLQQIGHKLGNPSPATTTFKPRRGWTSETFSDHAVLYDPAGHPRILYYPEARVARLDREFNVINTRPGAIRTQPWVEILPRFSINQDEVLPNTFNIYDSKGEEYFNAAFDSYEAALTELNTTYPNWEYGWYWEDEPWEKWWQRLMLWIRTFYKQKSQWVIDSDDLSRGD